jgi:hypothetical protein
MIRRTTLSTDADDLAVLEDEARRRGLSLAALLREAVAEKADDVRERRRPRFGIASIEPVDGKHLSELTWRDEDAPARGD